MTTLNRRRFIHLGGIAAPGLGLNLPAPAFERLKAAQLTADADRDDRLVKLRGDGLGLSPAQYSHLLVRLAEETGITEDSYSLGGTVEQLPAHSQLAEAA